MKYKVKYFEGRFWLYQKILFWWVPSFTVASCGEGKVLERVSCRKIDTLVNHCRAKNEDKGIVKSWVGNELYLRVAEEN